MKKNVLPTWIRWLLVGCSIAMAAVIYLPIWRIQLDAPQYPEGLELLIYADKLGGNIDIINGLNHYIGMKTLHANDFVEFSVLKFIILAYAVLFLLVGVWGKPKWLGIVLGLFVLFGIVAMADFWQWEYQYGHNLNPNAAIIVPGMAYQPPLIGFKQLLNFGAYSIPHIGGFIFIIVGVTLLIAFVIQWKKTKTNKQLSTKSITSVILFMCSSSLLGCTTKPVPLKSGVDNCFFCKMGVSDSRFGSEIITKTGKIYKFDDVACAIKFIQSTFIELDKVEGIYVADFVNPQSFIKVQEAKFIVLQALRSPMGGNMAAFPISTNTNNQDIPAGKLTNWNAIINK